MKIQLALEIVLDLAERNTLSKVEAEWYDMLDEREAQVSALLAVSNLIQIISKHD